MINSVRIHPQDADWAEGRIRLVPWQWRGHVRREYTKRGEFAHSGGVVSGCRAAANTWLRELSESVENLPLPLTADDDLLTLKAERMATACRRVGLVEACSMCLRHGINPPITETAEGTLGRLRCVRWWRRQLRKSHGRVVEDIGRQAHITRVDRDIYVTNAAVARRRQQKSRNRAALEACIAINELGEFATLAELSDASVSNPKIKRGELMMRMAGFEAVARELGHVCEFWTVTLPSKYHASKIIPKTKRSIANSKFSGATAREGQAALQSTWAKIRAKLKRQEIPIYGMRVCEPQHDGTPHWHLLLCIPAEHAEKARGIAEAYACEEDQEELITAGNSVRFKAKRIDWSVGSAVGYIAKYIAKNIDGFAVEADLFGNDAIHAAERVDAWASTNGIRQFQQVGGPPVTIWRELRRVKGNTEGTNENMATAIVAADKGDWAGYIKAMGGPVIERKHQPVKLYRELPEETNVYGEPKGWKTVGVRCGIDTVITREHEWKIEWAGNHERKTEAAEKATDNENGRVLSVQGNAGDMVVGGFGEGNQTAIQARVCSGMGKRHSDGAFVCFDCARSLTEAGKHEPTRILRGFDGSNGGSVAEQRFVLGSAKYGSVGRVAFRGGETGKGHASNRKGGVGEKQRRQARSDHDNAKRGGISFLKGGASRPWSSVNNCTGGVDEGHIRAAEKSDPGG